MSRLWPALIRAQHSEDPSVVKLFDLISGRLKQEYQTLSLGMGISERQLLSNMDDQIVGSLAMHKYISYSVTLHASYFVVSYAWCFTCYI